MPRFLAALLFLVALIGPARAQEELETFHLRHRSAEQILPQIEPFVEPGGALTGMGDELFLRASRANRDEIRRLIDSLDHAARRLLISVRHDNRRAAATGGRNYETRGSAADRVSQQVQVVDGGRAYIHVGYSLPIALRQVLVGPGGAIVSEGIVYRDLGTGFYVEPRVSGDRVTLEISPEHDAPANLGPGSISIQRLSTTVSARLGEWVEIGASNADSDADESGAGRYSTRSSLDAQRVLLKVEGLP